MTFTRSKVEEARFFLGYLDKVRTKIPDFDCNRYLQTLEALVGECEERFALYSQ